MSYNNYKREVGKEQLTESTYRGSTVTVAKVTFVAYVHHSFLIIENLRDVAISMGPYSIPVNGTITVSTFSADSSQACRPHSGIYYNLESYYNGVFENSYNGRVSISTIVYAPEYVSLNAFLNNQDNNVWTNSQNCHVFCLNIWNMISETTLSTTMNPVYSIREVSGYQTNVSVPVCGIEKVRYVSTGGTLVSVNPLTGNSRYYTEVIY